MTLLVYRLDCSQHQEPALLVDHVEELSEGAGVVQVAPGPGLDALQQAEACAQAIAVLMGGSQYGTGGDPSAGMLIGASKLSSAAITGS